MTPRTCRLAVLASWTSPGSRRPSTSIGNASFVQRSREQLGDATLERAQIADADVGDKEREERAGMDGEQALAPVDPEEVGVPVVAGWWGVDERDRMLAEQVEQLAGAADDHWVRA